jgi:hypothetical protein
MSTLMIQLHKSKDPNKYWKFSPKESPICLGDSKYAQIKFRHPQLKKLNGVFEYKNKSWWYIDFENFDSPSCLKINPNQVTALNSLDLQIKTETQKRLNKTLHEEMINTTKLSQGEKIQIGLFLTVIAGLFIYVITAPKKEQAIQTSPGIKIASKPMEITLPKVPRQKMLKKHINEDTPQTQLAAAKSQEAPAGPAKSIGIASFDKSKIQQILGKVNLQANRSKKIIISNTVGQTLGGHPSAQAIDRIQGDGTSKWGSQINTGANVISTGGKGGGGGNGTGFQNYGSLSGSKVGNSGVGLLEEESVVVGGLDREVIAQYIKTQIGQILYCYERQLSATPNLFGKLSVKFTINGTGQVISQNIGENSLKSSAVESCVLQKVASWKFPVPSGNSSVLVTYPFLFKSTQ